jgi:hypothetical protein
MGDQYRMPRDPDQSRAALARDAALDRLRRTRRWVILGTAGLTAGFAALVAALAPGRSLASKHPAGTESAAGAAPSTRSGSVAIPRMPPAASSGDLGLQGPGNAPSPVPNQSPPQSAPSQPQSDPSQAPAPAPQPPVVSGGS